MLGKVKYVPLRVLQWPDDPGQRECGYFYIQPASLPEAGAFSLCDLKGNHDQARWVVFSDGMTEMLTEAEFQAALQLPRNAAFAAALKKADG